jgi:hypothetical protein
MERDWLTEREGGIGHLSLRFHLCADSGCHILLALLSMKKNCQTTCAGRRWCFTDRSVATLLTGVSAVRTCKRVVTFPAGISAIQTCKKAMALPTAVIAARTCKRVETVEAVKSQETAAAGQGLATKPPPVRAPTVPVGARRDGVARWGSEVWWRGRRGEP